MTHFPKTLSIIETLKENNLLKFNYQTKKKIAEIKIEIKFLNKKSRKYELFCRCQPVC